MIDRDHPLSVVRQAKLLQISRGAVYYRSRPTSEADLALMRRIDELHLEHPFMGARMLGRVLARQGIFVGRLWEATVENALEKIDRASDRTLLPRDVVRMNAKAKFNSNNCAILGR